MFRWFLFAWFSALALAAHLAGMGDAAVLALMAATAVLAVTLAHMAWNPGSAYPNASHGYRVRR